LERVKQLQQKLTEQSQGLEITEQELSTQQTQAEVFQVQVEGSQKQLQAIAQQLSMAEQELSIQQETQTRLQKEQREKQRQLDKLEATSQAQQEAQGTYATKAILSANLSGLCGLVAQLGQVETRYQLALSIAAGGRLGYVVVENDTVAAAAIELLKQKRAGRATFLPLNKVQPPRLQELSVALRYGSGFIDLAINLIEFQPRYQQVFAFIFGNTVVFETLQDARPFLGQHRIVTLDGELLESSGAMTGGSKPTGSSLSFGTVATGESEEIRVLRQRLGEIEQILLHSEQSFLQNGQKVKQLSQEFTEAKQQGREQQLRLEQLQRDIHRLTVQKDQFGQQIKQNRQEWEVAQQRLQVLAEEIPVQEVQLQQEQQRLAELEASQTHSEWQEIQKLLNSQQEKFQEREHGLRQAQIQLQDLENQRLRLQEKIQISQQREQELQQKQQEIQQSLLTINTQLETIAEEIQKTEVLMQKLSEKLGETKQKRDATEALLQDLKQQQQQQVWQLEKLQETQQQRQESLVTLQQQLQEQQAELPDPLPEIPDLDEVTENLSSLERINLQLEQLQKELRSSQKRLEAMEPVNMLALEEHYKTQERLQELSEKLSTLEAERTELLLRMENFTTLRFRAFKEAFDAVNINFQTIFASLSDGDGYLELEDAENPFNGGLNLIAHPKGKPVQRLSSMSGGEKSLTALSFIFSLQRYRPSPFYAFDEVDMFLDGANVEKLSKMIQKQAQQAQFMVVSLRRPMIESSERTIGVTQARGAYTQVLGIKL
jgi:chromosome segregation protein